MDELFNALKVFLLVFLLVFVVISLLALSQNWAQSQIVSVYVKGDLFYRGPASDVTIESAGHNTIVIIKPGFYHFKITQVYTGKDVEVK